MIWSKYNRDSKSYTARTDYGTYVIKRSGLYRYTLSVNGGPESKRQTLGECMAEATRIDYQLFNAQRPLTAEQAKEAIRSAYERSMASRGLSIPSGAGPLDHLL